MDSQSNTSKEQPKRHHVEHHFERIKTVREKTNEDRLRDRWSMKSDLGQPERMSLVRKLLEGAQKKGIVLEDGLSDSDNDAHKVCQKFSNVALPNPTPTTNGAAVSPAPIGSNGANATPPASPVPTGPSAATSPAASAKSPATAASAKSPATADAVAAKPVPGANNDSSLPKSPSAPKETQPLVAAPIAPHVDTAAPPKKCCLMGLLPGKTKQKAAE
jgi:hypothetical protein